MPDEPTTPSVDEATRQTFDAYNRRDYDAAVALYSPNAIFDTSPLGMGVFEGREAIRGVFEDWQAAYEDYEIAVEETHDLGAGVLFAVSLQKGRLHGGAGAVQLRRGWVILAERGVIVRVTVYTDIDEARAAAERLAQERG